MILDATSVQDRLAQQGIDSRIVPIHHIRDLQNRLVSEYEQGQLAEQFYHERLQFYRFSLPEEMSKARSIIVVALPRPQTPVNFLFGGKRVTLILPPTYAQYNHTTCQIGDLISTIQAPEGFRVRPALLPFKLLAACSGLTEYGRNNVCYIAGLGSFFQLAAYYSDLPAASDPWQEPHMLARCNSCQACLIKCPTGAISNDRFLLHAERCLSYYNESASTRPFPAEISPTMHNALMGCMLCQRFCPEDKPFLEFFEHSVDFSEQETAMLLHGAALNDLSAETVAKLEYLELTSDLDKLPRNLGVFFKGKHNG